MARVVTDSRVRWFIGDVRDGTRLRRAVAEVDYVVHAAALKHIDKCEYDPMEAVHTNVYGARNVINAAIDCGVKKVLAISSDKAANPINLYGATKLCADKLFIAANAYSPKQTAFSVVRFGNFVGSRGSVIQHFRNLKDVGSDTLPITDHRMTRFFIRLPVAAETCIDIIQKMRGGEIFTPKMPAFYMHRIAHHIHPGCTLELCGIRPGEKITEDLIIADDACRTWDCGDLYVTMPKANDERTDGFRVKDGFHYNSLDAASDGTWGDLKEVLDGNDLL